IHVPLLSLRGNNPARMIILPCRIARHERMSGANQVQILGELIAAPIVTTTIPAEGRAMIEAAAISKGGPAIETATIATIVATPIAAAIATVVAPPNANTIA